MLSDIKTFYGIDTSRVLANNFYSYTATENCYFVGTIAHDQDNVRMAVYIDDVLLFDFYKYNNLTVSLPVVFPIVKGQVVALDNVVGTPTRVIYGAKG